MKLSERTPSLLLALVVFGAAAFWILGSGYLPPDDVLRHSAFATAHKTWDQILVGRPEALFDQSPGWHAFLRLAHTLTHATPEGLALFSIFFCFVLFLAVGLIWVRRWEAWALTLAAFFLVDGALVQRIALGRPFLVTGSLVICLLGSLRLPRIDPWVSKRHAGWTLAGLVATWVHGSWYLLFLIPACLLLAARCREALRLALALGTGCFLGALLTGHPVLFLWGELAHLLSALGQPSQVQALAMEFLPGGTDQPLLLPVLIGLSALWKRGSSLRPPPSEDAVLLLGVVAWILGFFWVWRFYLDWAFPALALWTAWRLEDLLEDQQPTRLGRIQLSAFAAILFIAAAGRNAAGRWSVDGSRSGLDPRISSEHLLLPGPGGVVYSNSMYVFYATFFLNPTAEWRYVLGYEPGLMKAEDYRVYQLSHSGVDPAKAFEPWVTRMTPQDRLILLGPPVAAPGIPGLRWTFSAPNKWVGQKP